MGKVLFIDIKDTEVLTYLFYVKGDKYELKENKTYPLSAKCDFSLDPAPEDVENTYLGLPLSMLNFRVIDLPFSDKDRIREVLPFELDGIIMGGSENVVIDAVVVGTSENKRQVLAVYLEKDKLKKILEKMRSYRIDPVFVTCLELRPLLKDFDLSKLLAQMPAELDRLSLTIEELKTPTINLRRNEFSYTGNIDKTKKPLTIAAILVALIALVSAGDFAFKIISTRTEIGALKNEVRKEYQELFPGEKNVVNELHQLKAHIKELRGKEDIFIGVNPLDLLLRLSKIDRQGAVINEVSTDKTVVTLKGEAPSLSEIQQLQNKLKNAFDEVNISDSRDSAQGKRMFTITAREKRL